jgi:hypothetical protein
VDVVDRDGGSVRAKGGDRDVTQPDGLFDQGAGAVVFAHQVAGFVVAVEDGAGDAARDLNPLAEGVVDGGFGGRAVLQGLESSGSIPSLD